MVDVTRRRAMGLTAGLLSSAGLTACGPAETTADAPKTAATYDGTARFDHGVASGDATDQSVILWSRVTVSAPDQSVDYTLVVSTDASDFSNDVPDRVYSEGHLVQTGSTAARRDFTIKVDLGDLVPDTVYHYQFMVMTSDGPVVSPVGRTQTLPAGSMDELKLAVVSCSNYPYGYFNVYRAISERDDLDGVVHLGDYLYEYGIDGYGGEVGREIDRSHTPITEIVTLDDYRARHAQYKSDPDLQAAHAAMPWYCTWDDHESANDSYRTGAENHNPEENEGDWSVRKQVAVQAYLEWMPVRDPQPGMLRESIYRSFQFGDLATLLMLEGRLTGRSDEISWINEVGSLPPEEVPFKAMQTMSRVADENRTMLGDIQETWVDRQLRKSVNDGTTWQVLGNQVIMAEIKPPQFERLLTQEQIESLEGYPRALVGFSALGLPWNLDAWDGFPAARTRLYDSVKSSGANLVTVTGDTHTAWANTLKDTSGEQVGVEFGCTSVTSPGMGVYLPFDGLGEMFADANSEVTWHAPFKQGFTILTLTKEAARADFFTVSTVLEPEAEVSLDASFESRLQDGKVTPLVEA